MLDGVVFSTYSKVHSMLSEGGGGGWFKNYNLFRRSYNACNLPSTDVARSA